MILLNSELDLNLDNIVAMINNWLQDLLIGWGISSSSVIYTKLIVMLAIVLIMIYVLQLLAKYILSFVLERIHRITQLSILKYLKNNRLPHFLALVLPYSFVRGVIPIVFWNFKSLINPLVKLTDIYMVFMVIWIIVAIIKSLFDILQERRAFQNKPMKSYIQVIQIILFVIGAIVIFCIITGKSVGAFFAAMGAASAILMLMFSDTIKGFAGSILVSANDTVRIGDWITMNKYGADGNVEEITLSSVIVRNFDKTITTIPTYSLISDSFQNWRGMQESGGRRMRRALHVKYEGIHFLTEEEIEKYKEVAGLKDYIEEKLKDYAQRNNTERVGNKLSLNEHRLTNNDIFIQYAILYLRNHPKVHQDLTLLVRQLNPTTQGLPVEVYAFTNTTVWAEYEMIMSEIMNHLISVVPTFGLMLYEESSGTDEFNVNLRKVDTDK